MGDSGRLYKGKNKNVFVASNGECPRIDIARTGQTARFSDDYSKGFRVPKSLAKVIFS